MENKICTSIEQSKKLMELGIDVDTADMWYSYYGDFKYNPTIAHEGERWFLCQFRNSLRKDIPCWSLAALLNVIPIWYDIHPTKSHVAMSCDYGKEVVVISDNLVDACVEMILKLHELNLL